MATFPVYNSSANINTQPAGVERHQAAEPFKANAEVLGTLQDVTQKLSDANDVMQETKLKTYYETALAKQTQAAEQDPNSENSELHLKALEEIKKNAPKIDNQEIAGRANLEMNQQTLLTGIKIQDTFRKKQMIQNDTNLDTYATTQSQLQANAVSDAAGMQIEHNFLNTINKNVAAGLINRERGEQLIKSYKMGVLQGQLNKDGAVDLNSSKTYKDINEGKFGLDVKETTEALNMAAKKIKQNQVIQKEQKFNNGINMAMSVAKGGELPSEAQIAQMLSTSTIDRDFAEAAIKAKNSPELVRATTEGKTFSELTQQIFKAGTREEQTAAIKNLLTGASEGKVRQEDMQLLMTTAVSQGKEERQQKRTAGSNAVETLSKFADQSKLPRADLFREFQKQIADGKEPAEAVEAAQKKTIIDNVPGASSLKDVPNVVVNKDSNIRFIFPKKTTLYPAKLYNPKTGELEANTDREISSNDNSPQQQK